MQSALNSCLVLMKLEFSGQIFKKKLSNIKCHGNPSKWEPSFSMRKERRTYKWKDMTKLTVAFRNCANDPKKIILKLN